MLSPRHHRLFESCDNGSVRRNTYSVAEILKAVLPASSQARLLSLELVRLKWEAIVGIELALRTEPAILEAGILTVRVTDAAWGRVILKLEKEILVRLASAMGSRVVTRVRFMKDGKPLWEGQAPPFAKHHSEQGQEGTSSPPPPKRIIEAARAIGDPGLREQVTRIATRYLAVQAKRRRSP